MKYISQPKNNSPKKIESIDNIKFQSIKNDSEKLHEVLYYKRRLKEIKMNANEFDKKINGFLNTFVKSKDEDIEYDFKEEAYIEFNRVFINFIGSFKSFTEHCEKKIKSLYGEKSAPFSEFKIFESGLYDSNLSYRLLKRLRDYAIHVDYPIDMVSFDEIPLNQSRTKFNYELNIYFSRKKLLENNKLKNLFEEDLNSTQELIDVVPLIKNVKKLIEQVYEFFLSTLKSEYEDSAKRLNALLEKYNTKNLSITIEKYVNFEIKYESTILPLTIAKEYLELIK